MRRRGFTWTELVIVLAVVTILAAGVFAAFAVRVRPYRQRNECYVNLRRMGMAIIDRGDAVRHRRYCR